MKNILFASLFLLFIATSCGSNRHNDPGEIRNDEIKNEPFSLIYKNKKHSEGSHNTHTENSPQRTEEQSNEGH